MSVEATRTTIAGYDLVQLVGAVLGALVAAFVALGGYAFLTSLGVDLPVSAAAPIGATLVFTVFLAATVVALRSVRPSRPNPAPSDDR